MQFYPDYTFDQTVVNIKVGKYKFSAKSNTVKDAGWKELASTDDEETNEQSASLPKLAVEQHVKLHDSKINNKETKPPKLFTEDTLLTAMCNIANYVDDIIAEYESITGQQYCDNVEEFKKILRLKPEEGGQLGTGATQPVVIQTIQERAFVCKDEKDRLLPTQLGLMIIDFFRQKEIIKDYSFLINPLTSASYEKQLSAIQYGELSYDKFIATFKAETIEGKVLALEQYSHLLPKNDEAIACPTCKIGFLFQKRFRDKKTQEIKEYFGCSRSPDCNAFYSIVDGKPNLNASQKTEFKCPQCETGYLIKRTSKNAKTEKEFDWYFCSNYKPRDNQPECSAKYYDENGKPQFEQRKKAEVRPTGEKCPKCKDGNIVIREAFSEKHQKTFEFKGCDQYPKCEYIVKEKRKKETKPFSLVDKLKTMAQL